MLQAVIVLVCVTGCDSDGLCCRLWYFHERRKKNSHKSEPACVENGLAPVASVEDIIPMEIGYMNVIPKCLDSTGKYPVYENLPQTYAAVNTFLTVSPLEGECV